VRKPAGVEGCVGRNGGDTVQIKPQRRALLPLPVETDERVGIVISRSVARNRINLVLLDLERLPGHLTSSLPLTIGPGPKRRTWRVGRAPIVRSSRNI